MLERDPDLLERLDGCDRHAFVGTVYRVVWAHRSPLVGSVAHGLWNSPEGAFEILNTALEAEGAAAEFEAFWSLFEQRPDRAALTWELHVLLRQVVALNFDLLDELGVQRVEYGNRQYSRTREISDGLHHLGCDGLIVPSARYDGKNLVVYKQNLSRDCLLEEGKSGKFPWSDVVG